MTDADTRPSPDALLAQLRGEPGQRRARLKIFFGASPGVGKTYAMLETARRLREDGVDVVVGCVETHGRGETEALVAGLEVLPRKAIAYRGIQLAELDPDAALARQPSVILVDELAHTNAPGVRHPKRWQDVIDLLDAGIDVYTTLNVQHVESLVDVVAQITGVRVRETVPDTILERADEIELIDLAPEELLERFADGKVYVPDQARRALDNFFRRGNLMALRELALRRTAERVDADVQAYRREQRIGALWPTHERIVVCVGPSPGSERLVRAAHRIAEGMHAPWFAVHVDVTGAPPLRKDDRDRIDSHLLLAESLGAKAVRLAGAAVASTLLELAREHNVTRIVAGKPTHSRWRDRLRGSLLDTLIRGSGEIEIHVIAPSEDLPPRVTSPPDARRRLAAYVPGLVAVAGATAIGAAAGDRLLLPDDAMLFLFAIMIAALGGRGAGIAAAALAVAAYDFFFIPPKYTFAVSDVRHIMTFAVMFTVGIAMGSLVARLRYAEAASRQRERRTAALLAFTADAASARDIADVAAAVVANVEAVLGAPTSVLVPADGGALTAAAGLEPLAAQEIAVARWAHEHRRPAGRGTDTLPLARLLAVPLVVGNESAGVVAVEIERARRRIDLDARFLLEAIARQAGVAIARLRLAAEARDAALRAQAEELRSSLLSTVSHDLQTPLAVITGMATALRDGARDHLDADALDSLDTIVDEARRLGRILTNLLAITRVESGATLRPDWVPVEELVGATLDRHEAALAGRDVAIDIERDVGVLVDPVLTELLLGNLIENAAKHTPAGTSLEIRAKRDAGGVAIDVLDRGPGLPPGPPAELFEKFVRGQGTRAPGAGLGLAVCRGIATAHGGRIEARPRDGGGAAFRVWLPGGDAPKTDAPDEPAPPDRAAADSPIAARSP